ncbi:hypothetical protein Bca52824_066485 [Brassica carinata]|uniref:Uncharacterized protein n=1 Tax=Brassica carinata TaxID=52824 RepID=A0A8X7QP55_BRACI|nr:hypothetical protein Bca52824_066485 [Brassica carinata]
MSSVLKWITGSSPSKTFFQSDQMFLSLRMVTWSINLVATSSKSLLPYPTTAREDWWLDHFKVKRDMLMENIARRLVLIILKGVTMDDKGNRWTMLSSMPRKRDQGVAIEIKQPRQNQRRSSITYSEAWSVKAENKTSKEF